LEISNDERRKIVTMFKTKKTLILVPVIAVVVLLCATVGVVMAQDGQNPPGAGQDMLARVAQILGIDEQKLTDAFKQAQNESQTQRLANLVEEGKITQQQADQLTAWEESKPDSSAGKEAFDEWMQSRPDVPGLQPHGQLPCQQNMDEMLANLVQEGKITQEQADQLKAWEAAKPDSSAGKEAFEEWLKSRPDVPFPEPPGSPPRPQNTEPSSLPLPTSQPTN
jgi:polyhydroxyalkanoate synthesis regulator phasin